MGDLDNEVSEYIINFTNYHRHLPNWNNLTDDQRNEVNGIWTGFNKGEHTMQELEDAIPLARQPAGNLSLQDIHRRQRQLLEQAYDDLVADQQEADDMDIDGGGKTRKSKRRKSKRNKSKRKQRRKSKKRKSKRKTYRKKNPKRNKIGGFELPPGYENCEGCKCIRKIDNDDDDEIFPDPGRGPPPFPDMGAVRINNGDINDDNIYYEYDNNNNNPGDEDKPSF